MALGNRVLGVVAALAMACTTASAQAATLISGIGFWGLGFSQYTPAASQFGFSFTVPDAFTNPTTEFSDFSYSLNGVKQDAIVAQSIKFFDDSKGGMFDITTNVGKLSVQGYDIGSTGKITDTGGYLTFVTAWAPQNFPVAFSAFSAVVASNVPGAPVPAVPEPATWMMMIIGLCGVGAAMRRQHKKVQTNVALA